VRVVLAGRAEELFATAFGAARRRFVVMDRLRFNMRKLFLRRGSVCSVANRLPWGTAQSPVLQPGDSQ